MTETNLSLQPNVMLMPQEDTEQLRYLPGDFAMQVYRRTLLSRPGLAEEYLTGRQRMEYQQYLICSKCGRPCAGKCRIAVSSSTGSPPRVRTPAARPRSISSYGGSRREKHWQHEIVVLANNASSLKANLDREVLLAGSVRQNHAGDSRLPHHSLLLANDSLRVALRFDPAVESLMGSPPPWFNQGDWIAAKGRITGYGGTVELHVRLPEQVFVTTAQKALEQARRE